MPVWMRPFLAVVIGFAVPLHFTPIQTDEVVLVGAGELPPARAMRPKRLPGSWTASREWSLPLATTCSSTVPLRNTPPATIRPGAAIGIAPGRYRGTTTTTPPARPGISSILGQRRESRRRLVRVRSRRLARHCVEHELRRDRRLRCEIAAACMARSGIVGQPSRCTLAYMHHPRFTSTPSGQDADLDAIWEVLYDHGADIVLSGHAHTYERFSPMDPEGNPDPAGIVQFVAGTGGNDLHEFDRISPHSESRNDQVHGVLRLTLKQGEYDWAFVPAGSGEFDDAGVGVVPLGPGGFLLDLMAKAYRSCRWASWNQRSMSAWREISVKRSAVGHRRPCRPRRSPPDGGGVRRPAGEQGLDVLHRLEPTSVG